MKITVTVEDALSSDALELADPSTDKTDLLNEAVKTFVRVQTAKRLATLGGRALKARDVARRRDETSS
ncbi:type II toxin-antitoxin system VapB family antitoxin [Variovorax guangxiensis]|uniref:DUF2191 domain-containing protein n=1 Tax=Variovorax guangxiensis TaxID=1775474 RepID=A0A840G9T0_9BURK|nr:type II toxin-antitoxin system VapB family antitoxin [Variovorax guangxiensis]MBB4225598.1 hypothetical protein [Variovorax guangxiensis]